MKKLNIEYIQPEGTFYVFPKIPDGIDEMTFCKTMVKNFVVIVPGSAFGMEGFFRMSLIFKPEDIKRGMEQFEIAYKKTLEEVGYNKNKCEGDKCEKKVEKLEEDAKKEIKNN